MRFADAAPPSLRATWWPCSRAVIRGLRGQIVAVGAHNDHIGIAPVMQEHDSIRAFNW